MPVSQIRKEKQASCMDSSRALLLTPGYTPHSIISWEDAITLAYLKKAEVLASYDEVVRSPSIEMQIPAVMRLHKTVTAIKRGVKFSRTNVLTRDAYTCQYCGCKGTESQLNRDHVVPRQQGGETSWTNIVTSCFPCNSKKRNRTPVQAGMPLARKPFRPKSLPTGLIRIPPEKVHPLWKDWLGYVA